MFGKQQGQIIFPVCKLCGCAITMSPVCPCKKGREKAGIDNGVRTGKEAEVADISRELLEPGWTVP